MIQTWMADVTALHKKEIYDQYYREVPEFRRRKADRILKQEDKALSVGAWVLLTQMREEYQLAEDVCYNLSHSGNMVLCSVAEARDSVRQLGCDIQQIGESREAVAKRFFCPSETEQDFYRIWVLKESFMKATRMGMKLDMRAFEIGFSGEDKPYLKRAPQAFSEEYYFREYVIEGLPYRIAVCADSNIFASKVSRRDF